MGKSVGLIAAFACSALLTGCGEDAPDSAATPDVVTFSERDNHDVETPLPEEDDAADLGGSAPDTNISFCEAFATVPARYVDDAVFPIRLWLESFDEARPTAPEDAVQAIDTLITFGSAKFGWHSKKIDERPIWTSTEAAAAVTIADAAVAECEGLPLIVGPEGPPAEPYDWTDLDSAGRASFCASDAANVQAGINWYAAEFGAPPQHQQQIETAASEVVYRALEETGEFPDGVWYVASDFFGVGPDAVARPPAGGACDL